MSKKVAIDTLAIYTPPHKRRLKNLLTYEGVEKAANYNGYNISPVGLSNSYGNTFKVHDTEIKIETTSSYNRKREEKLVHIRTQPDKMGLWNDTRTALMALDTYSDNGVAVSNGIFSHAELQRIDYTIDIPYPLETVTNSLVISKKSIITALQDMVDIEESHIERKYDANVISSFRIGKGDKYVRIYDLKRKRNIQATSGRGHITRVELSLNSKSAIRELMNSNPSNPTKYNGTLRELESHLNDVANGVVSPFQGVLACKVIIPEFADKFKDYPLISPTEEQLSEYCCLKQSIKKGFLINEIRVLNENGNFLRTHHRQFEIHPWNREFQITTAFREETRRFLGMSANTGQIYPADTSQLFTRVPQPIRRWPMELTE